MLNGSIRGHRAPRLLSGMLIGNQTSLQDQVGDE